MTLLAINWAGVGVQTLYFIMAFSILVVLHEMGHFLPAKWFKCRVEKFYLFFNPWFSLAKKKIGETEWGLGWIPFGGYVKISGMVDESMDKEQLKLPPQPYEFRAKPAWQRLIIMLGGVIVNVLLAIIIFIFLAWVYGEEYLPPQNAKYGFAVDSLGTSMGLKDGDVIIKLDNQPVKDVTKVPVLIITSEPKKLTVLRDGQEIEMNVPRELVKDLNNSKGGDFTFLRFPGIIEDFGKESPAWEAGLKKGDQIVAIDSVHTPYSTDVQRALRGSRDKKIKVQVKRNNQLVTIPVQVNKEGKMGIQFQTDIRKLGFQIERKEYTFAQAIPAGWNKCWTTLGNYTTGLKQLFTGKANPNESLGSVISIGKIFPKEWGEWELFWRLTAIFSIILAFMNVLPIPALDGGHALFTIVEMITGRKPSDKFMEYAQMVGMVLLLGLMAYALGLDFLRLFRGH
jgi:regulator of sigma E protease